MPGDNVRLTEDATTSNPHAQTTQYSDLVEQQKQLTEQLQLLQLQLQQSSNDVSNNTSAATNQDQSVAAVNCTTLPLFWKEKPDLWFHQIEAKFRRRNIHADNSKYDAVLEALDSLAIMEISDVIETLPDTGKYEYLKQHLIKRFSLSSERQLHKLLSEIQLGDKKPSQLLRSMRELAKGQASDDLLRAKWLALLPLSVHNTLKVLPKASLNELADVADSIMENTTSSYVMATSSFQTPTTAENRLDSLEKRMADLATAVEKLSEKIGARVTQQRFRSRSKSPNHTGECFYHRKFKEKAQKCLTPCSYKPPKSEN